MFWKRLDVIHHDIDVCYVAYYYGQFDLTITIELLDIIQTQHNITCIKYKDL